MSIFCIEFSVFFNILSKLVGNILIFFLIFDSIYFIEGLFFVFEVLITILDTSFILGRSKIESEFTIKSGDSVFIISSYVLDSGYKLLSYFFENKPISLFKRIVFFNTSISLFLYFTVT